MGSTLTITTPRDYLFTRDLCSYGYFLLAPNVWNPTKRTFTRPYQLDDGVATVVLTQPDDKKGGALRARADRALSRPEQLALRAQITRMLRLDDDGVRSFHKADPRWKRSGRGRLFRSPTFFEDLIKTVTSCNVQWPSTVTMNQRLCEVINPAFPTPAQLRRRRPQTLRARCRVGYRDQRMVDLARIVDSGEIDVEWLEDPSSPDEDVRQVLLSLPGIGPYAANNVMQLLGRYGHVPYDTETIRHAKTVLGYQGSDKAIEKKVRAHYAPFGDHVFRSYWFELWDYYENKQGPSHLWEPRVVGKAFTASKL
ncbi:MAG: DNA-3-methyladenine glycosylase family protein [Phycisphaerales bacterium JB043]